MRMKVITNYKSRLGKFDQGKVFLNKKGHAVKVLGKAIEQGSKNTIYVVEFLQTGSVAEVESGNLTKGVFKDYLHRSVYGVGYLGIGKHKSYANNKITRAYKLWAGILERCYAGRPKWHTYENTHVCDRWHCFQNFAEDLPKIEGYDKWLGGNYQIDKDIKGGKLYSLETCVFLSPEDNTAEMNKRVKKRIVERNAKGQIVKTVVVTNDNN